MSGGPQKRKTFITSKTRPGQRLRGFRSKKPDLSTPNTAPGYPVFAPIIPKKKSGTAPVVQKPKRIPIPQKSPAYKVGKSKLRIGKQNAGKAQARSLHLPEEKKVSLAPRIPKKHEFKRKDIAPTSQSMKLDPLDMDHPATLPFIDPHKVKRKEEDVDLLPAFVASEKKDPKVAAKKKEKPSDIKLSEHLFWSDTLEAFNGDDELFFIQLPSILPSTETLVNKPKPEKSGEEEEEEDVDADANVNDGTFKGTLSSLEPGTIGKLLLYKSGKVKLKIGDVLFEIRAGMPCNFLQEVSLIVPQTKKYYEMGEVNQRLVAYPDIEQLL